MIAAAGRVQSTESKPIRVPLRDAPQTKPIDPATFHDALAFINAKPDELKWASIPWQTDLWEACRLACKVGAAGKLALPSHAHAQPSPAAA